MIGKRAVGRWVKNVAGIVMGRSVVGKMPLSIAGSIRSAISASALAAATTAKGSRSGYAHAYEKAR
jgi:hypothetical protein